MERCEFGVCGVKSKEKGQITMETAFESAPIEVLVCLKELHQENNHLKSLLRIQSRKDVRTLLSLTGNEEDSELHLHCKKEDSSINLEKLLDLCSSQATEIAKLKRDVDLLERRNSNLQNELEAKELEIDRMRLEMNKDAQKKIEAATKADRSTQTNEDQSKVTQYLPVPEQPSADLSGLQQNPEPSLFNHIFTPRSRLLPTQNLTFDSTPIRHDNPKHAKVHLHAPKFLTLITDNCWSLSQGRFVCGRGACLRPLIPRKRHSRAGNQRGGPPHHPAALRGRPRSHPRPPRHRTPGQQPCVRF
jgi:hypothetical protein